MGSGVVVLLKLAICPVVGAVTKNATTVAEPAAETLRGDAESIDAALHLRLVQEALRGQLTVAARAAGTEVFDVPAAEMQAPARSHDYRALADRVDAVLEVGVTSVRFDGDNNHPLALSMRAHANLVRTRDNATLYAADFEYEGERHWFDTWIADHAAKLSDALAAGYTMLGECIHDSVLRLYPVPDRHAQLDQRAYGLAPYDPRVTGVADALPIQDPARRWTVTESAQPTLRWQAFPRPGDAAAAPQDMSRVRDVHYDLLVARAFQVDWNDAPREIVLRRTGLTSPSYTFETPLEAGALYYWTVRATFELDGRPRVTEWGATLPDSQHVAVPSARIYHFVTPRGAGPRAP